MLQIAAQENFEPRVTRMGMGETKQIPFGISIGPVTFHPDRHRNYRQKIVINGVTFEADPKQLLRFFERLVDEFPGASEGVRLEAAELFVQDLLKARVAFLGENKGLYPTSDFRSASYDFLSFLKQARYPAVRPGHESL